MSALEEKGFATFCSLCNTIMCSSSFNLQEVLQCIVTCAAKAINVKASSIRLLNQERQRLLISAAYGLSEGYLRKGPVEVRKSLVDQEVLKGKTVAIPNVAEDPRIQYREEARKEGIHSMLCVPLIVKGEPIGVLRAYTSDPHVFSEIEIRFLLALGELGAVAIEHYRCFVRAKEDYEDLVAAVWKWYDWGARPPRI